MNSHKHSTAIAHLASVGSDMQVPSLAVYAGTKAFNDIFGVQSQIAFQKDSKLRCLMKTLIIKPGTTTTEMVGMANDPTACMPEQVSLDSLHNLGNIQTTYGATKNNFL